MSGEGEVSGDWYSPTIVNRATSNYYICTSILFIKVQLNNNQKEEKEGHSGGTSLRRMYIPRAGPGATAEVQALKFNNNQRSEGGEGGTYGRDGPLADVHFAKAAAIRADGGSVGASIQLHHLPSADPKYTFGPFRQGEALVVGSRAHGC